MKEVGTEKAQKLTGVFCLEASGVPGAAGMQGSAVDSFASAGITDKEREVVCMNPLEEDRWVQRLTACGKESVFLGAGWAAVLRETYGFTPQYLGGLDEGRAQALLPLMEVSSFLTGRRGISLPFTDECEPIAPNPGAFQPLFDQALALGAIRGWRYLEFRGGRAFLPSAKCSQKFYLHDVQLVRDVAALFSRLKSPVRRAIRKAEKSGVTVEISNSDAAVESFYSLQCKTRRKHGLPPQPFRFFWNIHRHLLTRGQGFVVLAHAAGRAIAANIFLHGGRRATYKFGASEASFQDLRASDLVMWAGLKHCANLGFSNVDLGRTSMTNEGLRRFKLGWGASERVVEYFKFDLRRRDFVESMDAAFGWHNRVFALMPLRISRLMGHFLYRHIA